MANSNLGNYGPELLAEPFPGIRERFWSLLNGIEYLVGEKP